jgi:hypothetical protein
LNNPRRRTYLQSRCYALKNSRINNLYQIHNVGSEFGKSEILAWSNIRSA